MMAIKSLRPLLDPSGIAVIGGSDHPGTVGRTVLDNLAAGGFDKQLYAVNTRRIDHPAALWVGSVEDLPATIDVAVLCTPADTIADLILRLGRHGIGIAIVLTGSPAGTTNWQASLLAAARSAGVRVIGPNTIGLQLPHAHLNASFGRGCAAPGHLAMIAQSGAIATGVVDWAQRNGIRFSGVVSCGDALDVDMADMIDLFAADPQTHALLLHMEGIKDARRFLAAARAAARAKPVIALKAGRSEAAAKAALTHTGALAGSFDIYAAAFRRAGILMVDSLSELFSAAEMLSMAPPLAGSRLGIVTNGGGAAILALDALQSTEGRPASLRPETIARLDAVMPGGWSRANPVDILGDADAARYRAAIEAVQSDPNVDALLVMNCPIGLVDGGDLSRAVSVALGNARKTAFACWLGGASFDRAATDFADAGVPLFNMPEDAVRSFAHLVDARRAAQASRTALATRIPAGRTVAREIIDTARAAGRTALSEPEAQRLLAAYGLSTVPSIVVATAEDVAQACAGLQAPYAVKIVSPQGAHKSDIGGVALALESAAAAQEAAEAMAASIANDHPDILIGGFVVEAMIERARSYELAAGIAADPTFGPVIMIGAGGKAVEILHDRAFGLPPLDGGFAREMIASTRIAGLLEGYRDEPPVAMDAIANVLCTLSAIAIDLPDLVELDINPLLVDPSGAIALDARIRIAERADEPVALAICPIPTEWSADLVTRAGDLIHVRPASPDDAALLRALFEATAAEDLRFRFGTARAVAADRIAEITDVDYARAISFLALRPDGTAAAAATLRCDADGDDATVSVFVREDCKGRGISWTLMQHVMRYTRARGIRTITSFQNVEDRSAIQLEQEMGFAVTDARPDEDLKLTRTVAAGDAR